MHPDLSLLITFTAALVSAFVGGFIARKLHLSPLVGYLVAGVVIGPFTPGFVGDSESISQLAEAGVIFMMFGVGLHFSLKDLWAVRKVAIPGAVLQILLGTAAGLGLGMLWGWDVRAGLVLGMAASIASTVVLLRGLADHNLVNTIHGRTAIGWLVLEDLATVLILVLLPLFANEGEGNIWVSLGLTLVQTAAFVAVMLFIGARALPWLLARIALTRSRELFVLAVVALALGTAFVASELFGVSLALGAFLAGVVIGESDVGHQAGAEIIPFRDIFSVIFFVSVGMLVNPLMVWNNLGQVLALTALVVLGKALINLLLGFILPASGKTIVVVAASLSQIGEFSFLLGLSGVALGILTRDQYGLILAAAVISIMLNPFIFNAIPFTLRTLQRVPWLWRLLDTPSGPAPEPLQASVQGHVLVVGHGRVGRRIRNVLEQMGEPVLVVESDAERAAELQKQGVPTLYGDAANSEILDHAGLGAARAAVVTPSDEATTALVVAALNSAMPALPIIARAGTVAGMQRLAALGADHVVQPELEGALEILAHALRALNRPADEIQLYMESERRRAYEGVSSELGSSLDAKLRRAGMEMMASGGGIGIVWQPVQAGSPLAGRSLLDANLRAQTGASVVALVRAGQVLPNPTAATLLQEDDMVGLIGNPGQIAECALLLAPDSARSEAEAISPAD